MCRFDRLSIVFKRSCIVVSCVHKGCGSPLAHFFSQLVEMEKRARSIELCVLSHSVFLKRCDINITGNTI